MNLPKTILVATDFSDTSEAGVEYAVTLAEKLGAKLYLINAIGVPAYGVPELGVAITASMIDTIVHDNQVALDKLTKKYATASIEPLLRTGDPRDQIVQTAKEVGADLIVMGTHGRRGVKRALLGSVAEGVLRHAHCPVLAVRAPTS
jgi:nucleotide-binding universal stress UspA family protein